MTEVPPEEWKIERQFHPCLSQFLFMFGMVIVSIVIFYTKVMIYYEHQNIFESYYAINFINLLLFALTNHIRSIFNKNKL